MTNFNDKFMKIVFVGNSDVGKTTLVKRYANDVFGDFGPTIGLSHVTKEIIVDDKSIQMHMWDTAGQERYRSLVRAYYRRSHGCVIVFDVTNSSSFEGVKYWMEDILKKKDDKTEIFIVGNKSDFTHRQVEYNEGYEYAKSKGCSYMETSALSGEGVNELMNHIAETIVLGVKNNDVILGTTNNTIVMYDEKNNEIMTGGFLSKCW
jgi:small GTP-binding protein